MNSKYQNNHAQDPQSNSDNNKSDGKRLAKSNVNNSEDDLIQTLQNRRENRRARQVFEWETIRREIPAPQIRRDAA